MLAKLVLLPAMLAPSGLKVVSSMRHCGRHVLVTVPECPEPVEWYVVFKCERSGSGAPPNSVEIVDSVLVLGA